MRRFYLLGLLAALAAVLSLSSQARAEVPFRHYASLTGGGACTASDPCDLSGAMFLAIVDSQGSNDGTVSCIGGGSFNDSFSAATSITIDCPNGVLSAANNGNGSLLTFNGTSSQVVVLRNLTFDGTFQHGAPFIKVTGGPTLIIENCKFQNLFGNNGIAIQFLPNARAAQLIIRDSVFANNGIGPSTGGGLQVAPTGSGSASVKLERVSFDFNVTSMVLSGPVDATMINSTVSASRSTGIIVGPGVSLEVKDSTLADNVGAAISVSAGGSVRLSNDDIKSNQIGISNSGGQALTYSNNAIFGNGSTATLTPIQRNQ